MEDKPKTIGQVIAEIKLGFRELRFAIVRKARSVKNNFMKRFKPKDKYYEIVKAKGQNMSVRELGANLRRIGYFLQWIGCEYFVIVNEKKKKTNIRVMASRDQMRIIELQEYNDDTWFGKGGQGSFHVYVKNIEIDMAADSIIFGMGDDFYLAFYNFNLKHGPMEKKEKKPTAEVDA